MGLRELKKTKTRKMISDLATRLFIEKGYAEVTTAEIARLAEVSVPTLFNYFPTKETLVFDEEAEREEKLIAAVTSREPGVSILDALHEHFSSSIALSPEKLKHFSTFKKLIDTTPELSGYAKQMWMRYEQSLATVLQKEAENKIQKVEAEAIAHFILDSFHRALKTSTPKTSLNTLFKLLKEGWKE
ncbi:TetR/AcrR family transcriptional regulator [Undibacterium sp. TJN19]|uniref:TetR/AcrR family transcriptional regulator n=1 Tax=Undibacterium sp. TJN19 TaxID=3413055 RepID=UPI003BF36C81